MTCADAGSLLPNSSNWVDREGVRSMLGTLNHESPGKIIAAYNNAQINTPDSGFKEFSFAAEKPTGNLPAEGIPLGEALRHLLPPPDMSDATVKLSDVLKPDHELSLTAVLQPSLTEKQGHPRSGTRNHDNNTLQNDGKTLSAAVKTTEINESNKTNENIITEAKQLQHDTSIVDKGSVDNGIVTSADEASFRCLVEQNHDRPTLKTLDTQEVLRREVLAGVQEFYEQEKKNLDKSAQSRIRGGHTGSPPQVEA